MTVTAVSLTAHRFGGPAAWISAALALSGGVYLGRMAGGLPRSFAFPIVAGIILALVRGSIAGLAGLAIAGANFYPVSGAIAGLSLPVQAARNSDSVWPLAPLDPSRAKTFSRWS